MSGIADTSSLRKRATKRSALTGSTWERPDRKQTIELTLDPLPAPAAAPRGPSPGRAPDRHLARQLEQVAVQEEEAGEAEVADHPELLIEPALGLAPVGRAAVAIASRARQYSARRRSAPSSSAPG